MVILFFFPFVILLSSPLFPLSFFLSPFISSFFTFTYMCIIVWATFPLLPLFPPTENIF